MWCTHDEQQMAVPSNTRRTFQNMTNEPSQARKKISRAYIFLPGTNLKNFKAKDVPHFQWKTVAIKIQSSFVFSIDFFFVTHSCVTPSLINGNLLLSFDLMTLFFMGSTLFLSLVKNAWKKLTNTGVDCSIFVSSLVSYLIEEVYVRRDL